MTEPSPAKRRRVVVVANRLPVSLNDVGEWETSPGGLVSALTPILQEREGAWVGWAGLPDEVVAPFEHDGIFQRPLTLSPVDIDGYYLGFSNGTLWPLYHDAVRPPEFHRHWWRPYREVNERFAEAVIETARPHDVVWVHDYQLQLVPALIRSRRPDLTIGFYLHIPFPPPELFAQMPWRRQILEGLLGSDVVAFQTRRSADNFARSARRFTSAVGRSNRELHYGERAVRVDRAPIGIDTGRYRELAARPETAEAAADLRARLGNPDRLVLGVDRLDYTKGIDVRLKAFQTVLAGLESGPKEVQFMQIAVPSREDVGLYQEMREAIERLVGQINGEFGRAGMPAVHYLYRGLPVEQLAAAYLAADVMMVTPLRDGMNLVAKEYVATRVDGRGVLVLSEFAGASEQLRDALIVNPHDVDGMAATLRTAITLGEDEERARMRALRRVVEREDVFVWAGQCLAALGA